MSWNYQIIKHGDEDFRLHEVHKDESGRVHSWTANAELTGTSMHDIHSQLKRMLNDVQRRHVLKIEDLPQSENEEDTHSADTTS